MASYFPRGQQTYKRIEDKLVADYQGVAANGAFGMVFVTNQELTLDQRSQLAEAVDGPVEILHLERVSTILDQPKMHPVRAQFLNIDSPAVTAPDTTPRTTRQILDAAPSPPGAPDNRMLYDGLLLLQVVALPVPTIERYPTARDPRPRLRAASETARQIVDGWPSGVSLLASGLDDGWTSMKSHEWGAGWTTGDADQLVRNSTAAVAFTTRDCAIRVDRTWATRIHDDHGDFAFYAAREPEVAAELLVALGVVGTLLDAVPGVESVDIAVLLTAAPSGSLVSSERAVSGGRFGKPAGYLMNPRADVPTHHLDSGRFKLADVQDGYSVARELLGPWLVRFRGDDLFDRLREPVK